MRVTASTNIESKKAWSGVQKHMEHDEKLEHKNSFLATEESKKLRKFNKIFEVNDFEKEVKNYIKKFGDEKIKKAEEKYRKLEEKAIKTEVENGNIDLENLRKLAQMVEDGDKNANAVLSAEVAGAKANFKVKNPEKIPQLIKAKADLAQVKAYMGSAEAYASTTLKGTPRKERLDKLAVVKLGDKESWDKVKAKAAENWDRLQTEKNKKRFEELNIKDSDDLCAYYAARSLERYMQNFGKRNENLKVFDVAIHVDEKGAPHAHYRVAAMPDTEPRYTKSGKMKAPRMGFSAGIREEMEQKLGKKLSDKAALSNWREQEEKELVNLFEKSPLFTQVLHEDLNFYRKKAESPDIKTGLAHEDYVRQKEAVDKEVKVYRETLKQKADNDFNSYRNSLLSKRAALDAEDKRQKARKKAQEERQKELNKADEDFQKSLAVSTTQYRGPEVLKSWARWTAKVTPKQYAKKSQLWYTLLTELGGLSPAEAMRIGENLDLNKGKDKEFEL